MKDNRTAPSSFLSARGLAKSYGKSLALAGVDFDIGERAFTTLLGPSGCGKTTILRLIAGFEQPSGGTLTLDGLPLAGNPPEKRPVNTVFQSYALFPHLSVAENVAFSLRLRRGDGDIDAKVRMALETVHMAEFAQRFPHELSGGQQQRVAVARAMIATPRLLLLDEPLSALDRKMRAHLQIELKDLQRRLGIAFIYVTHDQEEALALSDTIIVMNKGRILQAGPPSDVYARPANAFVADFVGGATLIQADVRDNTGGAATVETVLGTVTVPALPVLARGDNAVLVLRPQALKLAAGDSGFAVTIRHAVYQGSAFLIEAEHAGKTLHFISDTPPDIGSTAYLAIRSEKAFVTSAEGTP